MVSLAPPLDARPAAGRRLDGLAVPALAGLLAFACVAVAPQVLNDGDSWWHVAAGGWMLDHHSILRSDVFSYTFAGKPWHAHEWLAEVLMALAFHAAGWSGVVLLYGAAAGAALAILARRLGRALAPFSLIVVLLVAFGCMSPNLLARPHLLALPLLAAWTAGLLAARDKGQRPPLALAGLMIPWANLHGGYVLGLVLLGPFALEALIAARPGARVATFKEWALFGVASLAACLVTPFGLSGLIFPVQLLGMSSIASINEWRPVDFSRVGPLEIALVASLYVMLQRDVRLAPLRLVLLLLLLHMALHHARHQILLAMIGPMLLADPLGKALAPDGKAAAPTGLPGRGWVVGCVAAALLLTGARLAFPIVRVDSPNAPITALQHVPAALRAQPVFNDSGFGGYLIAEGVRPFIDGRTDMYGDAFVGAYLRAERLDMATVDGLLARWRVSWTLLAADDALVGVMDRRPGWRRLYADRYAVVHVREAAFPDPPPT